MSNSDLRISRSTHTKGMAFKNGNTRIYVDLHYRLEDLVDTITHEDIHSAMWKIDHDFPVIQQERIIHRMLGDMLV